MTTPTRRLPGLPVKSKVNDRAIDALLELAGIWKGDRGDPLDRVVTLRDLGSDIVTITNGRASFDFTGGSGGGSITPIALTELTAEGAYLNILLSWAGTGQAGYAYTEIWRATSDDLGTAVMIATSVPPVYPDHTGGDVGYYYWVRAVCESGGVGVKGPFNAVAGVYAETAKSSEQVRSALTSSDWQASTSYGLFQIVNPTTDYFIGDVKVRFQSTAAGTTGATEPVWSGVTALGGTITDGGVTWQAVEAGHAPFIIGTLDGEQVVYLDTAVIKDASIENAKINTLAADKIFAASGTIAQALIGTGEITNAMIGNLIQSSNYSTALHRGWQINKAGNITSYGTVTIYDTTGNLILSSGGVPSSKVTGLGAFATLGKITPSNVSTYIQSATIDTLYIAGEAVTVPRHYYSTTAIHVTTPTAGWTSDLLVASLSLDSHGSSTSLWFSGFCHFNAFADDSTAAIWQIMIRRNGSDLLSYEWMRITGNYGTDSTVVFSYRDDSPPAGTNTYSVYMKAYSSKITTTVTVYTNSLTVMATRR